MIDFRQELADAKFYDAYARYADDDGKYESWEDAVARVMDMHRKKYAEQIERSPKLAGIFDEIQQGYNERLMLGSQRALQFGGDQIRKHEIKLFNCLARDTRFVTSDGMRSFDDFEDGDTVTVLTPYGNWKNAVVRSYGRQQLYRITINRCGNIRQYRATRNHRWLLSNDDETDHLEVGDRIRLMKNIFNDFEYDHAEPDEKHYVVSDIAEDTIERVWCLEVEDDRAFVLDGGIPTGNCAFTHADRPEFFGEIKYTLLGGCGAGFSVQRQHIDKLPAIQQRKKQAKMHMVEDSIEGWATAIDVLMSSYFVGGGKYPEYEQRKIFFDLNNVRPKGAPISGGFIAPGPEGLRQALDRIEHLLQGIVLRSDEPQQLRTIDVYDITMHTANAVLSGGVRRSATICLFSPDDDLMLNAKTGSWHIDNPQRARSNNSAVFVRGKTERGQFSRMIDAMKQYGEPGFVFVNDPDIGTNPCVTGDTMIDFEGDIRMTMKQTVEMFGRGEPLPPVKSMNMETRRLEYRRITDAAMTGMDRKVLHVIDNATGLSLKCTPEHEIYTAGRGPVPADQLKENDTLVIGRGYIGTPARTGMPLRINRLSLRYDVYDITVEGNHNFFANDILIHNCSEIGLYPMTEDGRSGMQFCNLTEINGGASVDRETFFRQCRLASQLGTLQAGYTDFRFLGPETKEICEREALLGVSITGFFDRSDILLDPDILRQGARIVKKSNREMARLIGINQAARTTCVKPAGTTSILLKTASGIHPEHSRRYIRNVQLNNESKVMQLIAEVNPIMVSDSAWAPAPGIDSVVSFPIQIDECARTKREIRHTGHLEHVRLVQENWVRPGTNRKLCVNRNGIEHNVSNTVIVDQWDELVDYLYDNQDCFSGVSLIDDMGDKAYYQAPNISVMSLDEITGRYGEGGIFASGLVIDGLRAFDDNLWKACEFAMQYTNGESPSEYNQSLSIENHYEKVSWAKRYRNFAHNYFGGDMTETEYCLKDVHILHKYISITKKARRIDWSGLQRKTSVEADRLAAAACAGGTCEIDF